MKAELNNAQRLRLIDILPKRGKLIDLMVSEQLTKKLMFTIDEVREMEIDVNNGVWTWKKDNVREFEFDEDDLRLIKGAIQGVDEKGEADFAVLGLSLVFCPELLKS